MASRQSLLGLDWLNIFLADVRYGIGAFFAVYLLTHLHWEADKIGGLMAIPGITSIIFQSPAGALIDATRHKKLLVIIACAIVGLASVALTLVDQKLYIFSIAFIIGITITIYAPAISAVTMGLVGYKAFPKRMGRNQMLNHTGNVVITLLSGLAGYYLSFQYVFYIMAAMCILSIIAVSFIRESDIDHAVAREAQLVNGLEILAPLKKVIFNKNILLFVIAVVLFYLANGALYPLLGQKISIGRKETSTLFTSAGIIIAELVMIPMAAFTGWKASEGNRKFLYAIAFAILPLRAFLYTLNDDPYYLLSIQILDGAAAGISSVIMIIMIADLTKGSGRFNFMQGMIASSVEAGEAVSHYGSGILVKYFGYQVGFLSLSAIGVLALLFYLIFVQETKHIREKHPLT